MTKHHYVYKSFEEEGREYIGVRSCNCLPEEDTKYFGSFRDKSFNPTGKTILFVCETREEIAGIEIELHDFFDVAVNPQFANMAKATSTGFDRAGVSTTEETKKKMSVANSGKPHTEEWKQAQSERMSGKNNPMYSRNGENNPNYGKFGALNPNSKAIIAIQPDGTKLYFGSSCEAASKLRITPSNLCRHLKSDHVPTKGKFKGWKFVYEGLLSENR